MEEMEDDRCSRPGYSVKNRQCLNSGPLILRLKSEAGDLLDILIVVQLDVTCAAGRLPSGHHPQLIQRQETARFDVLDQGFYFCFLNLVIVLCCPERDLIAGKLKFHDGNTQRQSSVCCDTLRSSTSKERS